MRDIRIRVGKVIVPLILTLLLAYFVFHGLTGERGVFQRHKLEARLETAEQNLAEKQEYRDALLSRTRLLESGQHPIAADLLEERAKAELGFAHADEVILIPPDN